MRENTYLYGKRPGLFKKTGQSIAGTEQVARALSNINKDFGFQIFIFTFAVPERRYVGNMIIINVKDGESLDKALKRFKKKFEKTGVLRELRSRQAFEKKSVTRRHLVKHAIYKQNMNAETV